MSLCVVTTASGSIPIRPTPETAVVKLLSNVSFVFIFDGCFGTTVVGGCVTNRDFISYLMADEPFAGSLIEINVYEHENATEMFLCCGCVRSAVSGLATSFVFVVRTKIIKCK